MERSKELIKNQFQNRKLYKQNKFPELMMKNVFFLSAFFFIAVLLLICLFLFVQGIPAIVQIGFVKFIFGTIWQPSANLLGILPMILASFYVTLGALVIGAPIGLLTAVFLSRFCPKWLYSPVKTLINLMASIPSVIYGFFGLVVIVPLIRELFGGRGMSILAASIILGLMILPTIISVAESSLVGVDQSIYEGALALGASHERSVFFTIVPAAKSGMITAVILGMGRALGETMAVKMVCGNQPVIPHSILDGARTLTANIVLEMGYASDLHRQALIATAVVLFVLVLLIYAVLGRIKNQKA